MIFKSKLDENEYKHSTLPNNLESILITNRKLDKSACAIAIKTGAFQDNIPGIAHFLEHMLFMGTEKFPSENDFMEYLAKHNGYTNAYTCDDITVYYFDIDPKYFVRALERFACFFHQPLFIEDTVKRELNAVDSEFKNGFQQDAYRLNRLFQHFCNEPFDIFSTGNNETLDIENIREKVINFWKENYDSFGMKLVVFHNKNIQGEIDDFFGHIPSLQSDFKKLKTESKDEEFIPKIFNNNFTNKIIIVEPINDVNELKIHIEIPNENKYFKKNSYGYIIFLLEEENKDSLIYKYKEKMLSYELDVEIENNLVFCVLIVTIKLTKQGYNNINEVIQMFYDYLNELTYSRNEYEKLKMTKRLEFEYLESVAPIDHVTNLARSMHYYPIENIINYDYIYEEFDHLEIFKLIGILKKHENWLVFFVSKKPFINKIDFLSEKYYGVKYLVSEPLFIKRKKTIQIKSNEGAFTFISESIFKAPKSCISILLNREMKKEDYIKTLFYLKIVEEKYTEKYYDFLLFNLVSFDWYISHLGIELVFSGLTENIIVCIEKYIEIFIKIEKTQFPLVKALLQDQFNIKKNSSPYKRVLDILKEKLLMYSPSVEECINEINSMVEDDVEIDHKYYIDVFICSNGAHHQFLNFYNNLLKMFKSNHQYTFAPGFNENRIKFITNDYINHSTGIFIKNKEFRDYKSLAALKMIAPYFSELFFDQLRTKEALGYIVISDSLLINKDFYHYFIVQSEKDCEFLENRIIQFIKEMNEKIQNLSDDEFETFRESAISSFEEKLQNLNEYFNYFKKLYYADTLDLDFKENMIEILKSFKKEELFIPVDMIIIHGNKKNN